VWSGRSADRLWETRNCGSWPMLLKNSISAGKWTPVAEADLCNRSVFDDLN
jgi:hypothetical protein